MAPDIELAKRGIYPDVDVYLNMKTYWDTVMRPVIDKVYRESEESKQSGKVSNSSSGDAESTYIDVKGVRVWQRNDNDGVWVSIKQFGGTPEPLNERILGIYNTVNEAIWKCEEERSKYSDSFIVRQTKVQ
jgi:hypothetical protein